jgi:WD40 repeat protein
VWDAATGEPAGPPIQFSDSTQFLKASPDSRRLAVGFDGGTVRLVDPENAEMVGPPLRHAKDARTADFTPDSAVLATAGLDGTVHLWDAATGEPTARPLWMGRVITSLAFSQDGRSLATGGSWELRLWDVSWLGSEDGPGEIGRRAEEAARLRIDERGAPRALPPPGK